MIHNHVMRAARRRDAVRLPPAFLGATRLSGPHTDVLQNDIVRSDPQSAADDRDARRRRGFVGAWRGVLYRDPDCWRIDRSGGGGACPIWTTVR